MADVKDFIIPEEQFGGLYKLSSNLERERIRKEDAAQKAAGKKASMATFLSNYIDPKEYFTGTVHDPAISQGINDILTKGAELAQQKGVDGNMLITALSPMVNKLGRTSQNLKELERQRKEAEGILKSRKGIDLNKFNQSFRESAYFNPDGTLKDLSEIDPTHNYTDEVLTKGDVYTPEAFDEFVAKSGKETKINRVKVTDARGGSRMTNAEMTAPTFMKPDVDASGRHIGFVPEYEEATDGDKKIMHDFLGDKGEKINAPVRMITDEVFESLPNEAKAYLRQEARRYAAQHNIPLGSQQALNFAKALGYDELKKSGKQYSTFKEIQEQKAAPAPRTSITVNTGNNPSQVPTVDIFSEIVEKTGGDRVTRGVGYATSGLSGTAQKILIDYLRNITGDKELSQADFYVKQEADGTVNAVDKVTNKVISPINAFDVNSIANKDLNKVWGSKAEENAAKNINLKGGAKIATEKQQQNKMVTMVLPDGRKGQIPESAVAQFLKDNPKAKQQ